MAVSVKRKDSKGRILRDGEQQRADGRYMFTYKEYMTGKRKFVYSWCLEKTDKTPAGKKKDLSLREKERLIEVEIHEKRNNQEGKITVLELVEQYVNIKRNVRPTTKKGYKTVVNVLKEDVFAKRHINTINTLEARNWLISLQEGGHSYSSIHNIRGVVRPAFRMAVENDWLVKNPFDFPLAECLINDSIKRDALTAKQQRNFLKFIKEDEHFRQYYDGMFILFETGLRISELCGLTIKDIDLEERTININKQLLYTSDNKAYIQDMTKSKSGMRILPINDGVYEAFKRVISSRKKQKIEQIIDGVSGFLFLNSKGKATLAYYWEKKFNYSVAKYNKIYKEELPNITPHVCRHTYCSKMAKSGISVKTLQYLMGHSDVQTTLNIYTHFKLEDAKNDLEKLKIREEMQKEMSVIDMAEAKQALARVKGL